MGSRPIPIPENNRMTWNAGPITGYLIHIITQYRGYKDACVRHTFPILLFHKEICHIQIGFMQLGMFHFCPWLQSKRTFSSCFSVRVIASLLDNSFVYAGVTHELSTFPIGLRELCVSPITSSAFLRALNLPLL